MFTPKVAKAQTQALENSPGKLPPRGSTLVRHRPGHEPLLQGAPHPRTIGTRATPRLFAQQASMPAGSIPDNDREPALATENMIARPAPFDTSWDFSKVPLYPPDGANRPQARSHVG